MDFKMEKVYYIFTVIIIAIIVGVAITGIGLMIGVAVKGSATNTQSEESAETKITIDGNLTTADVTSETERKVVKEFTEADYESISLFYQGTTYNNLKEIKIYNDGWVEAIILLEETQEGDNTVVRTTSLFVKVESCRITVTQKTIV